MLEVAARDGVLIPLRSTVLRQLDLTHLRRGRIMASELAPLLDYKDASRILKITPRSIRKLIRAGKLGYIQVGPGSVRFTAQDLQDFIVAQHREARQT